MNLTGIKFKIDAGRFDRLVTEGPADLATAFMDDMVAEAGEFPSESQKRVAIAAFKIGYACALQNVISILEGKSNADNAS